MQNLDVLTPNPTLDRIARIFIDDHMKKSMINYAMSVITDRALPDVRDGLKPVHRRILWAMKEMNMGPGKKKKSAGVVGEVLKKYHPHGDSSVYDAGVRMAQPWSLLHPLITGQGNFGSIDGDGPAAYRYTEMELSPIAMRLFDDVDKNSVDFAPNFDGEEIEPTVLPAAFPVILTNGTEGIAVGMATSIPPHNLREVGDAVSAYFDNPDITAQDIAKIMIAPDFPTGGIVHGLDGYVQALETGRGAVKVRATWHEEKIKSGKSLLVIDSIPYQQNKSKIVEAIAALINDKKLEDVVDLRDESNKKGIRVVVELKRDAECELVFNLLLSHKTGLEVSFSYNVMLLDDKKPIQMGVREIFRRWKNFRMENIRRATTYDLEREKAHLHLIDGQLKAIDILDEVISTIRVTPTIEECREKLKALVGIDDTQAESILSMQLRRLAGLQIEALKQDSITTKTKIIDLEDILANEPRQITIIREALARVIEKYGKDRVTQVEHTLSRLTRADLVEKEDVVVIMTKGGYVKRIPLSAMNRQNRGTRGKSWMNIGEDDTVEAVHAGNTHDYLLAMTDLGKVYGKKVYEVPESGSGTKGRHIKNIVEGIGENERIVKMMTVPDFSDDMFLVTVTERGQIKRTKLSEYEGAVRSGGLIAVNLDEGDPLAAVDVCKEHDHVLIAASNGKVIRFIIDENSLRSTGRNTGGNRGIRLKDEDRVVGTIILRGDGHPQKMIKEMVEQDDGTFLEEETRDTKTMDEGICLFTMGSRGVGKKTDVSNFKVQARAGKGTNSFNINMKTGPIVKSLAVSDDKDVVMVSQRGVTNRIAASDIRKSGRVTSGTKLMNIDKDDSVIEINTVIREPETEIMTEEQETA